MASDWFLIQQTVKNQESLFTVNSKSFFLQQMFDSFAWKMTETMNWFCN